jgi:hypothetical protein
MIAKKFFKSYPKLSDNFYLDSISTAQPRLKHRQATGKPQASHGQATGIGGLSQYKAIQNKAIQNKAIQIIII